MNRTATTPLDDDEDYARARARYEADPLLALVESYVLDAVGELSAEEFAEASDAAVELLAEARDWRGAVRRAMRWSRSVDTEIAREWRRYRERRGAGEDPDPAAFARRFADAAAQRARS